MSSEADITEAHRASLARLAELSLAMVEELSAAMSGAESTAEFCRLGDTFAKVGRCLRMTIALDMRITRGETFAPRAQAQPAEPDLDLDLDDDLDDEDEADDWHERFGERENLYDRLPAGDPGAQIAALARDLTSAARALRAPKGRPIILTRDYETLCRELIANDPDGDPPPAAPRLQLARGPPG